MFDKYKIFQALEFQRNGKLLKKFLANLFGNEDISVF